MTRALTLVALLALCLVGCGKQDEKAGQALEPGDYSGPPGGAQKAKTTGE